MTDNRTDTQNPSVKDLNNKSSDAKDANAKSADTLSTGAKNNVERQNKTSVMPEQKSKANDNVNDRANTANKAATPDSSAKHESKPAEKTADNMNSSSSRNAPTKAPEPQIKKLNIVIAGATYTIYCPADEEAELRAAENYLNNFATNIKKEAPNLNQENLLVLSCLNLYEQINTHKTSEAEHQQQSKQNEQLLNKIMQDAQSVL